MKTIKIMLLHLIFFVFSVQFALAATYGAGVTLQELTKVSAISEQPDKYIGKKVLVKGLVVEVCEKRGCWMDIASDKAFEKIQIKVLDGVIVFPMSAQGKEALVEGVVQEIKMSKDDAIQWFAHKAKEQGKIFDPASITTGQTIYRINATGAEITD